MRLATGFLLFCLLTSSGWASEIQGRPSLLQPSDAAIQSLELLHRKAESQIIRNDFEGAVRTYSDIVLIEPDDETAYIGLGHCYLVLGQFKKANEAYRGALSINPENEDAIIGIQKIMDPDGVEGMVHPSQMDAEEEMYSLREYMSGHGKAEPKENAVKKPVVPVMKTAAVQKTAPAAKAAAAVRKTRAILSLAGRGFTRGLERIGPMQVAPRPQKKKPAPAAPAVAAAPAPKKSVPAAAHVKILDPQPIVVLKPKESAAASRPADAVDARQIQRALRNTGFYSGPIDGVLGPASRKGIRDYQALHELTPDGVVGPKTWASLRLYLDSN